MNKKIQIAILVLLLAVLIFQIIIYTTPLQFNQITDAGLMESVIEYHINHCLRAECNTVLTVIDQETGMIDHLALSQTGDITGDRTLQKTYGSSNSYQNSGNITNEEFTMLNESLREISPPAENITSTPEYIVTLTLTINDTAYTETSLCSNPNCPTELCNFYEIIQAIEGGRSPDGFYCPFE